MQVHIIETGNSCLDAVKHIVYLGGKLKDILTVERSYENLVQTLEDGVRNFIALMLKITQLRVVRCGGLVAHNCCAEHLVA